MRLSPPLLCAYVSLALGQSGPPYGDTTNNICESSLASPANATTSEVLNFNGLGSWHVAVSTDSSAATIDDGRQLTALSPGAVANVWLDPFTDTHLTDGSKSYSACAYVFKGLPENTIRRGQDSDPWCENILSEKCVNAITSRAAETAKWLVQNPTHGPFSNLTPPILRPICEDILGGIGAGPEPRSNPFPPECVPFFDNGTLPRYPTADTLVLTSNVSGPTNCSLQTSNNRAQVFGVGLYNVPPGLQYPYNATNGSAVASYDELVHQVWPILTVYFSAANNSRQGSVPSTATMTCLRAAAGVKDDSRVPPALPAAEAVGVPGQRQLSSGAIAGIVIGALLGLAILGVSWWWCFFRPRRRASKPAKDASGANEWDTKQLDSVDVCQLDSDERPAEMAGDGHGRGRGGADGEDRWELEGGAVAAHELQGCSPPAPTVVTSPDRYASFQFFSSTPHEPGASERDGTTTEGSRSPVVGRWLAVTLPRGRS